MDCLIYRKHVYMIGEKWIMNVRYMDGVVCKVWQASKLKETMHFGVRMLSSSNKESPSGEAAKKMTRRCRRTTQIVNKKLKVIRMTAYDPEGKTMTPLERKDLLRSIPLSIKLASALKSAHVYILVAIIEVKNESNKWTQGSWKKGFVLADGCGRTQGCQAVQQAKDWIKISISSDAFANRNQGKTKAQQQ